MVTACIGAWWATALRGVAGLLFALLILSQPHLSGVQLQVTLGLYILVDGLLCAMAALLIPLMAMGRVDHVPWGLQLLFPALSIAAVATVGFTAALLIPRSPFLPGAALLHVVAVWALAIGVVELGLGLGLWPVMSGVERLLEENAAWWRAQRRYAVPQEYHLLLAATVALASGVAMLFLPFVGVAALRPLVGLMAALFGYLHVRLGLTMGWVALGA